MHHPLLRKIFSAVALLALSPEAFAAENSSPDGHWISLFNGRNLDGWTPKITKHPLGDNFANTFRVEDGMIKVSYDGYGGRFSGQFGHLYSNIPYSHYIVRLEYRFAGSVMPDAPDFSVLNSGIMIHAQSPLSLTLDQQFPVSLECQFLAGGAGTGPRQTASVCTPGTNIEMGGKLITQHIVRSTAPVFPPEEWVRIEVEVHGSREVVYRVNGKEVLRYQGPQIDPNDGDAQRRQAARALLAAGAGKYLESGHLALQAEGHPVWFRNIELRSLEE
jgi:hypothetical protein